LIRPPVCSGAAPQRDFTEFESHRKTSFVKRTKNGDTPGQQHRYNALNTLEKSSLFLENMSIQTTFSYKLEEHTRVAKLNRAVLPTWMTVSILAVSTVPVIAAFVLGEDISYWILSFGVLAVAAYSWFSQRQKQRFGFDSEQTMIATADFLSISRNHHRFETKWHRYVSFEETIDAYVLKTEAGYYCLIPKRAIPDKRAAEFRKWIQQVNDDSQSNQSQPVPLYQEMVADYHEDQCSPIYRFKICEEDWSAAIDSPLRDVENPPVAEDSKEPRNIEIKHWMVISFFLATLLISAFAQWSETSNTRALILPTIATPIMMLSTMFRINQATIKNRNRLLSTEFPENEIRLVEDGWLLGNHSSMSFREWQGVTGIFENDGSVGFSYTLGATELLPKRIFDSPESMAQFLNKAIAWRTDSQPKQGNFAQAVESDNPFQSPASRP